MASSDVEDDGGGGGGALVMTQWFSEGEGPLAQCLAWVARREAAGQDFVVFAHEVVAAVAAGGGDDEVGERIVRSYEAVDAGDGLWVWCQTPQPRGRHAHEVIRPGPVRLYADIDVHGDDAFRCSAARAADTLLQRLCDAAAERWQVDCRATVLDACVAAVAGRGASDAQGKFSRHLIVSMVRDGEEMAFPSAQACGEFVMQVQRDCGLDACLSGGTKPLCDAGVYRTNGTLRTFGSTKLGQNRPLRLLTPTAAEPVPLPRDGRLDDGLFRRTLVSLLPHNVACVPFGSAVSRTPSPGVRVLGKRTPASDLGEGAGPAGPAGPAPDSAAFLASVRAHLPDMAAAKIIGVDVTEIGWLRVRCNSKACAHKGAEHRTNKIYFELDPGRRQGYRQGCFSETCRRIRNSGRQTWLPLPPAVLEEARKLAQAAQPRTTGRYGSLLAQTLLLLPNPRQQ